VQGEQLAQAETGAAGDEEEGRVLIVDPRPLSLGLLGERRMLVAAVFAVQARPRRRRDCADLLGVEGLDRARAFLGPLGRIRHRVVA
jgi:hypothetical protein